MIDSRQRGQSNEDPSPERLRAELEALYRPPEGIPAEIDEQVLYNAREELSAARRSRRWGRIGAIAAGIVLVLWLERAMLPPRGSLQPVGSPSARIVLRQDIDGSGRVDILDAFALSRRMETGTAIQSTWDFNADGRVDAADVDAIALAAVSLNGGAS